LNLIAAFTLGFRAAIDATQILHPVEEFCALPSDQDRRRDCFRFRMKWARNAHSIASSGWNALHQTIANFFLGVALALLK
jgi:hypothetical protein